ncbi:MAG: glycoside hydrolase family 57 protein [Syntrophales bacterium]|jgi:alpha-amylase|nr:glycoside hydrolase family 57 protein [Syntrophales bacterium]
MPSVCCYFQVHQPLRHRHFTVFDFKQGLSYEDEENNRQILNKVAKKCYLPTNRIMLDLIRKHGGDFRISFSVTGVMLEQMERYNPQVLDSFKRLADTGCVEFLGETYYHSLAFLYSMREFREQVALHREKIKALFGQTPQTFRNTELIYSNDLARVIEKMRYKAILAEGADNVLEWRSPNHVYQPAGCAKLKLLLRNYRLSDDIAFRFSNRQWPEYPLTADKFARWLHRTDAAGQTINLFMDYETFGEHQWADTGIFDFLKAFPGEVLKNPDFRFQTPLEVARENDSAAQLDVPNPVSWADVERDLTAWIGNALQKDAINALYGLERKVRKTKNAGILSIWRRLQTSDHFYYMCTKWFADGDVHKYFNPYASPYDAYINYMNILADFSDAMSAQACRREAPVA